MKERDKRFVSVFFSVMLSAFFCAMFAGCSLDSDVISTPETVRLVSWNVQTFFDAETSGLEYSEFRGGKSRWCVEMYEERLDRLCAAIAQLDADVLVLQEIENESVMYDIVNRLPGVFARDRLYRYMCFAGEPNAAIGCGVLSRLPLGKRTVHQVDSRIHGNQPQVRPLLEVDVLAETVAGASGERSVVESAGDVLFRLFVCHWKSKSGGEDVAALWQNEQENVLAGRLLSLQDSSGQPAFPAVICGDFNRDLSEFSVQPATYGTDEFVLLGDVPVYSGWIAAGESGGSGSYWYKERWEKIDHFFVFGAVHLEHFSVVADGPWARMDEGGEVVPFRFAVWNGQGYSDHFPVECVVALK